MYKAVFTIPCSNQAYIGYTTSRDWNGFAIPYFELAEAKRVMADNNKVGQYKMYYDEASDKFYTLDEEGEFEIWEGEDINTNEGIKHLYGIGAYSWIWDEETDQDFLFLAQVIDDFIYEFDTYAYRDVGIDRDEMVEAIKNQLKELTVYKQVYELWHNDESNCDAKFEALSKLLTV